MRILFVLGTSTGGVGTHVASLAWEYANAGDTVGIIGPAATNEHFGFASHPGIRFAPLPISSSLTPKDLGLIKKMSRLISTFKADVVHAHGFRAGLVTVLAAHRIPKKSRPPVVVSWHNQASGTGIRGAVEARIEAIVAKGADLTIGASNDLVARAQQVGARSAVFAPAAAPDRDFGEDVNTGLLRSRLLAELGLDQSAVLVLTVGRIAPQKNQELLIDALAQIHQAQPDVHVLIAGAADERELQRLRTKVQAGALPVHFLGQRADIAFLNQASDIFVLTSHWEARALVLQEAMLAGKPIIATAVGGSPQLVGEAGRLVPPGDVQALAGALTELVTDTSARENLGRAAAIRALDLPDEAEVARIIRGHYEQLIESR